MVSEIQKIVEAGKKYLEVKVELLKLDAQEQLSRYLMKSTMMLGIFVTLMLIIVFLAIGLAIYINTVLNNPYQGYFIVAGIFALLILMFVIYRRSRLLHRIFYSILNLFIFDKDE